MYVVHTLTRSWQEIALISLSALSLLAITLLSTKAFPSQTSIDVKIEHLIDFRESGLLVMNDTVTLSTAPDINVEPIHSYSLGFPFNYHFDLAHAFAYKTSDQGSRLKLDLNAGISRMGFYGVRVNFPSAVNISNGGSYEFTVVFVFSDSISASIPPEGGAVFYNASFPAYPSLADVAREVNVKIALPVALNYTWSSYEKEGISFAQAIEGSRRLLSYTMSNLSAFSDHPAWCYASRTGAQTQLLDFEEFARRIEILGNEQITVSDSYKVLNKAGVLDEIQLKLPREAHSVSAYDEYESVQETNLKTQQADRYTYVTITLARAPVEQQDRIHVSIQYNVPWKNHVTPASFGEFNVLLSLIENPDGVVRKLTTTVVLPEGAVLSSSTSQNLNNLQSTPFSTSLALTYENVTSFHDTTLSFSYSRPIFWNSFRPTIWMGTFVVVVVALVGVRRAYRPPVVTPLLTAVISIRADDLRSFVTTYDEKGRLLKEAESVETAARKGKIPRRQYKVRKMTIDGRLASLSRDLLALRDKLRMAGPRYAELMRQLEISETELQGAEAEISRAEVRYRRGDLSPQAYHNVLETSYRRRDRAQTTIDGVLLRLREEIT